MFRKTMLAAFLGFELVKRNNTICKSCVSVYIGRVAVFDWCI